VKFVRREGKALQSDAGAAPPPAALEVLPIPESPRAIKILWLGATPDPDD
jgi:hypothetical protein